MESITVVTWNVQGAFGVDVPGFAEVIAAANADVVVVQEIRRRQARSLARALGMASWRWSFKHLSWPSAEGLAVMSPHRIVAGSTFVLRRAAWWDWRRRIAVAADVERDGERFAIVNVHLSPHHAPEHRHREAVTVLEHARRHGTPPIIAGDCNDEAGAAGPGDFAAAGWSDAWSLDRLADVDGATNWTAGSRIGRAPTQRLDYVFAPPGWTVDDAAVLASADRFDWFAERSDHLPLSATLRPRNDSHGRPPDG